MLKPLMCLHHMHKSCRRTVRTDIRFLGLGVLRAYFLLPSRSQVCLLGMELCQ